MGLSILRVRISPTSNEWAGWAHEKANAQMAKTRGAMILASPWSPPASMKTNSNVIGGELKPESYTAYVEKYFNPDDMATCLIMAKEISECMYFNMKRESIW